MRVIAIAVGCLIATLSAALGVQPLVAVHDSEFTRALLNRPAAGATPVTGGTGFEWWPTNFAYFVMPESAQEAFRSDGTPFATVTDSNVLNGALIDADGTPKFPIVFSLASEAIDDQEIASFTNYVAAGGYLFVGSSAFTRNTNGTSRGNFALASAMGLNTATPALTNWRAVTNLQKTVAHRLVSHIPDGQVTWFMPFSTEDIPYGNAPGNITNTPGSINSKHLIWKVAPTTATVIATNDFGPDLLVQQFGKGCFIYYAPMEPLIGHGGEDSGMYAYMIFRKAIEWAFESSRMAIPRLSGWPYQYDAAVEVRHDLEAIPGLINQCETSAQYEHSVGLKGDYFPCTGPVRDNYTAPERATEIASLRSAVTNYGATIGSHNGGLTNGYTPATLADYWYWHWAPDEMLDTGFPGYANGQAYAFTSVSNSFNDVRGWLVGITNNARNHWVAPAYNSTREGSKELLEGLTITAGEEKLTFFPHWTLSTKTSGKHFSFLSIPLSDWYAGASVSHSAEGGDTVDDIHNLVSFYYSQGALINQYSHSSSAGTAPPADALWARNDLARAYCEFASDTNRFPKLWAVNAEILYDWWTARTTAKVTPAFTTNALESRVSLSVSNASDAQTAVEFWVPRPGYTNVQVFTNAVAADTNSYRTIGQTIRVRAGTAVTNVEVRYTVTPAAQNDLYSFGSASPIMVSGAAGVLTNDVVGFGTNLTAQLVASPTHGTLALGSDGGFTYTATNGFAGLDSFTYRAVDGVTTSAVATVTLAAVSDFGLQFKDDFTRGGYPVALTTPWTTSNTWTIVDGALQSTNGPTDYSFAYVGANWTNYSVEARLQFPAGPNVAGAALAGRINLNTGARYALWLYPGNTPFGVPNVLRLIKFTGWTTWSGTPMSEVDVTTAGFPAVGTNWHALKLIFLNNQITAQYDGTTVLTATDNNFSSIPALLNGSIGVETYKSTTNYVLSLDDVKVRGLLGSQSTTPVANPDSYQLLSGRSSTVNTLGVLVNDVTGDGGGLAAQLVTGPTYNDGNFTLNVDGSFNYKPTNGYAGADSFTYQVFDGLGTSAATTASLSIVSATNVALFDNFSRTNSATTLAAPWSTSGRWSLNAGQLQSLSNTLVAQSYAFAFIDTNWTDYAVEASVSFPDTQSGGGGIGGRLNAATGARYSAWIYADNSPYGFVHQIILYKWTDWTSPIALGSLNLPLLGQGSHTLKLSFAGSQISAYVDGSLKLSVSDSSYASGGVNVETYQDPTHYAMSVDYFLISRLTLPILPVQSDVTVAELTPLVVTNSASNVDLPVYNLSAPAGATINAAGVITWTPGEAQGPGTYAFTTIVTDGTLSATNSFMVTVTDVNSAPVLPGQTNLTMAELTLLTVTNTAVDGDLPPDTLTYTLTGPTGASIDTNGIITWTPDESQGPSTHTFVTVVSDGAFSVSNSFDVTVTEVNTAPTLPVQSDVTMAELTPLLVVNTASDSDLPANTLTYTLTGPVGASIDSNGVITWTPGESQGPSINTFVTVVSDGALSATNSFTVTVTEVNTAPTLPSQNDVTMAELTPLVVTNTASDTDIPANTLTYTLTGPTGASIDTNGIITWTPSEAQGPSTNVLTTVVSDGMLSATNSFTVTVTEVNTAPTLPSQNDVTMAELTPLVVTNTASDSDLPANTLIYTLTGPTGASIDTNGIITWTPSEAQGPSTNVLTTVVSDGEFSATNSFVVTVTEVNVAPTLPGQSDVTIPELSPLIITNTAGDTDIPANTLTYTLTGPTGASIDTNGIITWTPDETQGPSTNVLTTVVSDGALSATNSFVVTVTEVNTAPTLPVLSNVTIPELTPLIVTNTASDSDLPANTLTYTLTGPAGASISTNGIITWTPDGSSGPNTNVLTTVVSDGALTATNSLVVIVTDVPSVPPVITSITVVNQLVTVTWDTVSGQTYRLQFSDVLNPASWTDVIPDVTAAGVSASQTNGVSGAQRYYRVRLVSP